MNEDSESRTDAVGRKRKQLADGFQASDAGLHPAEKRQKIDQDQDYLPFDYDASFNSRRRSDGESGDVSMSTEGDGAKLGHKHSSTALDNEVKDFEPGLAAKYGFTSINAAERAESADSEEYHIKEEDYCSEASSDEDDRSQHGMTLRPRGTGNQRPLSMADPLLHVKREEEHESSNAMSFRSRTSSADEDVASSIFLNSFCDIDYRKAASESRLVLFKVDVSVAKKPMKLRKVQVTLSKVLAGVAGTDLAFVLPPMFQMEDDWKALPPRSRQGSHEARALLVYKTGIAESNTVSELETGFKRTAAKQVKVTVEIATPSVPLLTLAQCWITHYPGELACSRMCAAYVSARQSMPTIEDSQAKERRTPLGGTLKALDAAAKDVIDRKISRKKPLDYNDYRSIAAVLVANESAIDLSDIPDEKLKDYVVVFRRKKNRDLLELPVLLHRMTANADTKANMAKQFLEEKYRELLEKSNTPPNIQHNGYGRPPLTNALADVESDTNQAPTSRIAHASNPSDNESSAPTTPDAGDTDAIERKFALNEPLNLSDYISIAAVLVANQCALDDSAILDERLMEQVNLFRQGKKNMAMKLPYLLIRMIATPAWRAKAKSAEHFLEEKYRELLSKNTKQPKVHHHSCERARAASLVEDHEDDASRTLVVKTGHATTSSTPAGVTKLTVDQVFPKRLRTYMREVVCGLTPRMSETVAVETALRSMCATGQEFNKFAKQFLDTWYAKHPVGVGRDSSFDGNAGNLSLKQLAALLSRPKVFFRRMTLGDFQSKELKAQAATLSEQIKRKGFEQLCLELARGDPFCAPRDGTRLLRSSVTASKALAPSARKSLEVYVEMNYVGDGTNCLPPDRWAGRKNHSSLVPWSGLVTGGTSTREPQCPPTNEARTDDVRNSLLSRRNSIPSNSNAGLGAGDRRVQSLSGAQTRGCRLHISNIPAAACTGAGLSELFQKYSIQDVTIPMSPGTKGWCGSGYAFVTVGSIDEVEHAVSRLDGAFLIDRKISVQFTQDTLDGSSKQSAAAVPTESYQVSGDNSSVEDEIHAPPLTFSPTQSPDNASRCIEILNLDTACTEERLKDLLMDYGVETLETATDPMGTHKFALAKLATPAFATNACANLDGAWIDDHMISVRVVDPQTPVGIEEYGVGNSEDVQAMDIDSPKERKDHIVGDDVGNFDHHDYGALARAAAAAPEGGHKKGAQATRLYELSHEDQLLQYRYFRINDPVAYVRCLSCGEQGHVEDECVHRTCKHCGAVDHHFSHACPTFVKCGRCRQRGHQSAACKSMRTVAGGGPGDPCDICGQLWHVEETCTNLWRTYFLAEDSVQKVPRYDLTMGCYNCGASFHWGDDCPKLPKYVPRSNLVWSQTYANRFIEGERVSPAGETTHGSAQNYQLALLNDM